MLSGINPFKLRNKTKKEKMEMIINREIKFFPVFSPTAKDLLEKLLQVEVSVNHRLIEF